MEMSEPNVRTKVTVSWSDQKRKLKERFSSLTDKDLNFEPGKMEEMITRLQDKIGKSRHDLFLLITKR
jgi:uncharacterized protein YjbJ (UPF0337 family)